jgi:hypothetical protein
MTWLTLKLRTGFNPFCVVLLAHGYQIIIFSFAYNPMIIGAWYISLFVGIATILWIQRNPWPKRLWITNEIRIDGSSV